MHGTGSEGLGSASLSTNCSPAPSEPGVSAARPAPAEARRSPACSTQARPVAFAAAEQHSSLLLPPQPPPLPSAARPRAAVQRPARRRLPAAAARRARAAPRRPGLLPAGAGRPAARQQPAGPAAAQRGGAAAQRVFAAARPRNRLALPPAAAGVTRAPAGSAACPAHAGTGQQHSLSCTCIVRPCCKPVWTESPHGMAAANSGRVYSVAVCGSGRVRTGRCFYNFALFAARIGHPASVEAQSGKFGDSRRQKHMCHSLLTRLRGCMQRM